MTEDRRLIEDFIPIREISSQAAREKSIRKGHISTLHLWWARRPLVAARAAVFAALVPAADTPEKRKALRQETIDLCRWEAGEATIKRAREQILAAQRDRLNLPGDTPLSEVPPPKVLDMFAGGGAIPLEALRLGCETHAVELNPVAHIIQLCTLVYPQKYGQRLAEDVEKWGNWVIEKVRAEIGDLYPQIELRGFREQGAQEQGAGEQEAIQLDLLSASPAKNLLSPKKLTPVAYLWTRTVQCPNPACGAAVPLARQTWLCKKKNKYVALKVSPNYETKRVEFQVVEAKSEKELGFDPAGGSSRGNSTCRHCGTTVGVKYVKSEGMADRIGQQLMAIVCTTEGKKGKTYLSASEYLQYVPEEEEIKSRLDKLCAETELKVPNEPLPEYGVLGFRVQPYGLLKWSDLFTSRQLLALMTFVKWVRLAYKEMLRQGYEEELGKAIATYLGLLINRVADRASTLCQYDPNPKQSGVNHTFSRQALPMMWDFGEGCPVGESSGSAKSSLPWLVDFLQRETSCGKPAACQRRSAMSLPLESESLDAVITDPPYFDSVPYADLADFFYVWLKRSLGHLYPEHFSGRLTPKKKEAIMEPSRHGGDKAKAAKAYEEMMHQAFCEASRVLKPGCMMVVVYAHKTTAGWATLIDSLRRAGFAITEAWPLDTERSNRLRAQSSAALASSIFLVARKRTGAGVGDYATEVRPLLTEITRNRVATLIKEGVSGADLIIACIGAGLRAYTQYDSVELPNGEELDASSFLDEVQKEVLETILTEVLLCDKSGVSTTDKATRYYILARYEYGEGTVDFDEANTLARGVGVELDGSGGLTEGKLALVKKTKNKVQLRDYSERGSDEDLGIEKAPKQEGSETLLGSEPGSEPGSGADSGVAPTQIDILHRLLWLMENKSQDVYNFLTLAKPDASQLRLVAQALAGRALTPEAEKREIAIASRTKEQQAIDSLLSSWKRTVEDNLFTQKPQ